MQHPNLKRLLVATITIFSLMAVLMPSMAQANEAPVLDQIGNKTATVGVDLTFTATADDPDDGQSLTFSLSDGDTDVPAGATINPVTGVFSWTPIETQIGDHTFNVVVTDDGEPNLSAEEMITITVEAAEEENQPPVLDQIGNKTATVGVELTFTATADDPDDGQSLTFSLSDGDTDVPTGATINPVTGVFSWTPIETQIGDHTFNVVVTDDGEPNLSAQEMITITVEAAEEENQPPVLDPIEDKTVTAGQPLTFTATADDPDDDTLTFTLADGVGGAVPPGAAINGSSGDFSWTPSSADVGEHTFDVVVTDNGTPNLSDFETITVTVEEAPPENQSPVIDPIADQTVNVGQLLTFTANADDPDDEQTLTFTLDNGTAGNVPAGATIDPNSGVFSWTPTEAQIGLHTFDVVVTDDGTPNLSASATVNVTVNAVQIENLVQNPGFETAGNAEKRAANWTGVGLVNKDRRVCDKLFEDRPDVIVSRSAPCAFQFKLGRPKTRYIQQVIELSDTQAGDVLHAEVWIDTNQLSRGTSLTVIVRYADNSKGKLVVKIPRGTQPYRRVAGILSLAQPATQLRVRVVNASGVGRLLVDDIVVGFGGSAVLPFYPTNPAEDELIPLPPAAEFRGN